MRDFKTFEELAAWLHISKVDAGEYIIDNLETLSEFERGYYKGVYESYENMYHDIHSKLKHGFITENEQG